MAGTRLSKRKQTPTETNPSPKKRKKARFSELIHISHDEEEFSSEDDHDRRSLRQDSQPNSTGTSDHVSQATPTSSAFEAMFPIDMTRFGSHAHNPVAPSHYSINIDQKLSSILENHQESTESTLRAFMSEVKDQMYQLSMRVDAIENNAKSAARMRSYLSDADDDDRRSAVSETGNATQAAGLGVYLQNTLAGIAAGDVSDQEAFKAILGYKDPTSPAPSTAPSVASGPINVSTRGARMANRNAAKKEQQETAESKAGPSAATTTKKSRKPELSKVVRLKMFEMMGLYTPPPDVGTSASAVKAHGILSGTQLPDFTPNELMDPLTGLRLWRWEWDKTIRQSLFNTSFSQAICSAINEERERQGKHTEVPEDDWASLPDAVEAAYSNLRRERSSQLDPERQEKKKVHVKRGKKRQMKVEKSRRRLKALVDSHVDQIRAGSPDDEAAAAEKFPWMSSIVKAHRQGYKIETALDVNFMSSEEEVLPSEVDEAESLPVVDYTANVMTSEPTSASVVSEQPAVKRNGDESGPNKKTFRVHRPSWRSALFSDVLEQLDRVKPPERAFKRVLGQARIDAEPPAAASEWMVSQEWKQAHRRESGGEFLD